MSRVALGAVLGATLIFGGVGCDELSARREIQKGDKAYGQARFREAIDHYEKALGMSDLTIGHHNAGLAYYRLFTPGDPSEENKKYAENSAKHFLRYLESSPNDKRVIDLVTQIWIDSDQYELALEYWKKVLANNPNDPKVLGRLADVNRAAGNFEAAMGWLEKRVEVETDEAGKVNAYMDMASVQISRLRNSDLVDDERLVVADKALGALRRAAKINPDNPRIFGYMGGVFHHRSLAHGASWARTVDKASQRYYNKIARDIAAKKKGGDKKPEPKKEPEKKGDDKPKPGEQK